MAQWRPYHVPAAKPERSLLDRPPNYDHDFDGRPPVGWYDDDPLLDALVREHPQLMPKDLLDRLKALQREHMDWMSIDLGKVLKPETG